MERLMPGTPLRPPIPFDPKPIETHRGRLAAALDEVYNQDALSSIPGLPRRHVFDVLVNQRHRVRFVITREVHSGLLDKPGSGLTRATEVVHVTASGDAWCPLPMRIDGYRKLLNVMGLEVRGNPAAKGKGVEWFVPLAKDVIPDTSLLESA